MTNKIGFLNSSITWLVEISALIKHRERSTSTPRLVEILTIHDIIKWSRSKVKIECFCLSKALME